MRQRRLALSVVVLGLTATALVAAVVGRIQSQRDDERFQHAVEQLEEELRVTLDGYAALLRDVAGLYAASEQVTLAEFRAYVANVDLAGNYPGVQGIGFARRVERDDVERFATAAAEAWGSNAPEFRVRPLEPERATYHPIEFLEPQDERNRQALGYDMASEPVRRQAMERARDTGRPALSGAVRLVQELEGRPEQPGFLVYHPLYRESRAPETVEERRGTLEGFVYGPFRAADFFERLLAFPATPRVGFRVRDAEQPERPALYATAERHEASARRGSARDFEYAGRRWAIDYWTLPPFDATSGAPLVWVVLAVGVFASLLLGVVVWREAQARDDAELATASAASARRNLATTLASLEDGVIAVDAGGHVSFVNPSGAALLGRSAREARGKRFDELVRLQDGASGAAVPDPLAYALRGGAGPLDEPPRLLPATGVARTVEVRATPVADEAGRGVGAVVVVRDVAERVATESRLRTQASVLANMVEGVSLSDEDGVILYTNPAEDRMFGYEPGELLGRPVSVLSALGADEHAREIAEIAERLREHGSWTGERRNRRKDGKSFWTRVNVTVVALRGRPCWVAVQEDVTESRRFVQELGRSRAMLQTVLDNIPQGVFWKDLDGVYVGANVVAARAKGVAPPDLPGMTDLDLPYLGRELAEAFRARDRHVMATGEAEYRVDERMNLPDGSVAWLSANRVPLRDADGTIIGVVGTWEDITVRKQVEERLREEVRTNETVSAIGARLAAELDLGTLVQGLVEDMTALTGATFGAFFYGDQDERGEPLTLYALAGSFLDAFSGLPMPRRDTGIFQPTFEGDRVVRSDDVTADPRYGHNAPFAGIPLGHPPVKSYLAVPVRSRSGVVHGALLFGHPDAARFTERHEQILFGVAAQAATALDNARLYSSLRQSEALLTLVTNSVPVLISYIDREQCYRFVNRTYEDWLRLPADEMRGRTVREVIGPAAHELARPSIERALAGERVRYQARLPYRGVGARDVDVVYVPDFGGETPTAGKVPAGFVSVVMDVTERRRADERRALVATIGAELAASLDHEVTLAAMARTLVPVFADWCAVDVLDERGRIRRLAVAHKDPEKVELARQLHERYPERDDAASGPARVVRTGEPEWVPEITDEMLAGSAEDAEHLRLLRELGLCSYVAAPLVVRGRSLGALVFVSAESGHHYTEDDLAFAVELGRRAGLALDNGRLFHARTESQERYRALVRASAQAVWSWRPGEEPASEESARWWLALVGQDAAALRDGRWLEAVHPDDRDALVERWERSIAEHAVFDVDFRVRSSSGEVRHVHARGVPVLESDGSVREWVGTLADATESRRAEEAVRESEARFRLMADSAPVLVWHAGVDQACDWFNRRWLEFVGRPLDDELGTGWLANVHQGDLALVREVRERGFAARQAFELKYRLKRHDGVFRWLLDHGIPLFTGAGELAGYIGSCIDITEIEQARVALERQSLELERLVDQRTAALHASHERLRHAERMASLGTLAAGIGHDLGNLLFPVRVRLESIAERCPPDAQPDVAAIEKPIHYLGQLAQGLRLLARDPLEGSGRDDATDVHAWWSTIEALMKNPLPAGVQLVARIEPGLPPAAISGTALTQAVFNLVQNAGDALAARGAGTVTVWAERDVAADTVRVGVTDDGPGMTPEVRDRCFEPFFTTKSRGISTGMGLSLVSGMVQRSGGTVRVESEPGRGTTFVITVPIASRSVRDVSAARPVAAVALDDERYAAYLCSALEQHGFEAHRGSSHEWPAAALWVGPADAPDEALAQFLARDGRRRVLLVGDPAGRRLPASQVSIVPAALRPAAIRQVLGDIARQLGLR